jgi:hypothetical protein
MAALGFLKTVLAEEHGKQSFGRVISLPYFFSAWAIGTFAGARNAWRGESVFDDIALLAAVGFSLYTGSKALNLSKGKMSSGPTSSDESGEAKTP